MDLSLGDLCGPIPAGLPCFDLGRRFGTPDYQWRECPGDLTVFGSAAPVQCAVKVGNCARDGTIITSGPAAVTSALSALQTALGNPSSLTNWGTGACKPC